MSTDSSAHFPETMHSARSPGAAGICTGSSLLPHKNEQLCTSFSKWTFEKAPCSVRLFKPFHGPVTAW